jgi:hypothetical protein
MKPRIHWPAFTASTGIALGIAGLLHWLAALSFWVSFAIAWAAVLVNGLIATVEDESPGGFNNPK